MDTSATQPTFSGLSFEEAKRQIQASAGNLGENSPAIPSWMRGRIGQGPSYIRRISEVPLAEVANTESTSTRARAGSSK